MIETLRRDIEALAPAAAALEPDAAGRARLMALALDHVQSFLGELADGPSNRSWDDVFASPLEPEFAERGRDPADVLAFLGRSVDRPGITTASEAIRQADVALAAVEPVSTPAKKASCG